MIVQNILNLNPITKNINGKNVYSYDGERLCVEEVVMYFYTKQGFKVLYSENSYWNMIMHILFYDVITAKVKGAVSKGCKNGRMDYLSPKDPDFNPLFELNFRLNGRPSDYFTKDFAINRRKLIKSRMLELNNCDIVNVFEEEYESKVRRIRMADVADRFSKTDFLLVFKFIPKDKLLKILERIILDILGNRIGLPDLIVVKNQSLFLVEVKSENDRLSKGQNSWLGFLDNQLSLTIELFLVKDKT